MQIAITKLRQALCETLNQVHYGQKAVVVTKREKPFVVILPLVGTLDKHTNLNVLLASAQQVDQEIKEIEEVNQQ